MTLIKTPLISPKRLAELIQESGALMKCREDGLCISMQAWDTERFDNLVKSIEQTRGIGAKGYVVLNWGSTSPPQHRVRITNSDVVKEMSQHLFPDTEVSEVIKRGEKTPCRTLGN